MTILMVRRETCTDNSNDNSNDNSDCAWWLLNRDGVGCRRKRREIKSSGAVRDGVTKAVGCLVFQDDFRIGDDRARGVGDRGAYRPAGELREYG